MLDTLNQKFKAIWKVKKDLLKSACFIGLAGFFAIPIFLVAATAMASGIIFTKFFGEKRGFTGTVTGGLLGCVAFIALSEIAGSFVFLSMFYLGILGAILGAVFKIIGAVNEEAAASTTFSRSLNEEYDHNQKAHTTRPSTPTDEKFGNKTQSRILEEPVLEEPKRKKTVTEDDRLYLDEESIVLPYQEPRHGRLLTSQPQPLKIEQITEFKKLELNEDFKDWKIIEPVATPVPLSATNPNEIKTPRQEIIEVKHLTKPKENFQLDLKTGQFKTKGAEPKTFDMILSGFKLIFPDKIPKILAPNLEIAKIWKEAIKKIFRFVEKEMKTLVVTPAKEHKQVHKLEHEEHTIVSAHKRKPS